MAYQIFISHSTVDQKESDIIYDYLSIQGYKCFMDTRDLVPGRPFAAQIADAIAECIVFVLIFSKNADDAIAVDAECAMAYARKKLIIPTRIEDYQPHNLGPHIAGRMWCDLFPPPLEKHLPKLLSAVPDTPPPPPPGRVYMIGIAGRTCSGKDSSVQSIASINKHVLHINTDIFFNAKSSHSCMGYKCWEHEQALRFDHLLEVITLLKNGCGTVIEDRSPWWGAYDCEINDSDLNDKTIVIVEGFLLFIREDIYSRFDNRMFIDVSDTELYKRRLERAGPDGEPYLNDVILPVSKEYELMQRDVAGSQIYYSDDFSALDIADQIVSAINSEFTKQKMDKHLVSPIRSATWEVMPGDILSDHEWHPIQFKNLKKYVRQNREKLDAGETLHGNTFSYRRNHNSYTDYEVQLRSEWAYYRHIYRYTLAETSAKKAL